MQETVFFFAASGGKWTRIKRSSVPRPGNPLLPFRLAPLVPWWNFPRLRKAVGSLATARLAVVSMALAAMALAAMVAGSGFSPVLAHHSLSIPPPKALLAACGRPGWEEPELDACPLAGGWQPARRLFLNGVCALGEHLPEKAIQELKKGLAGQPGVPYIWRWYLLNALVDAGEHDEAVLEFSRFLRESPPLILLNRSRELLSALLNQKPALAYQKKAAYLLTYIAGKRIGPGDYRLIRHWYQISSRSKDEWLSWKLAALMGSHPPNAKAAGQWADFPGRKINRSLGPPPGRG